MSKPNTHISLLEQLVIQKRKPEQVYENLGLRDEESPDGFPPSKVGQRRASPCTRIRSLISGVIFAALMAACIAGIVWWPARIQDQAYQRAAHDHTHQDPSAHPAAHMHDHPAHDEPTHLDSDKTVATCGSTIDEARALNCTWDLLAAAWLPPACVDQELTEDFRSQGGPWRYFADRAGTEELSEGDLQYRVGEGGEYYTSLRYHKTHGSYQWRKMHRAMERGRKIEKKLPDYHHTVHCGYVQMQQGDMEDLLTKIMVELMTY